MLSISVWLSCATLWHDRRLQIAEAERARNPGSNFDGIGRYQTTDDQRMSGTPLTQTPRLELLGVTKAYPGVVANNNVSLKVSP